MTEPPAGDGLTPPGPAPDEAAASPAGGMSVDAWLEHNRGRPRPPASPFTQPSYDLGRGADPNRSRTMASWALGLSLACCVPFAFLIAIGLAIAVLVRGAGSEDDHGKGRAIAALVISGLIVVVNVVYVVNIVLNGFDDTERDSQGQVVEGGTVTLDRLRVGDCFEDPNFDELPTDGSMGEGSASVEVVPCAEPHQAEVFHSIEMGGDDFPGETAVNRRSADCIPAFKEYVGKAFGRSRLEVALYFPTSMSWRLGDRTILCSLTERDLSDMTGSMKGSRR